MAEVGFRLLLITDGYDATTPGRVAAALGVVSPGTAAVQLRAKSLSAKELLAASVELRSITGPMGAPLLVNDRLDIALASGADGVQLPASGLPVKAARRVSGRLLVGASTHSLAEARMAEAGGADLILFGPVFSTSSKPYPVEPLGLARLEEVVHAVELPVFAVGGIDAERAGACARLGARVACIGAVLGSAQAEPGARAMACVLGVTP